jgi:glutamate---cysteine ligase / carboxylate-amine ligase
LKANFTGPNYTIGIEEELMILDPDSCTLVNEVHALLDECADPEHIKPELLESVLEISTPPAADTREAGAELRRLRAKVCAAAERRGLRIASAGTHPFAKWEDQRVVPQDRYRELVDALRFVARQEIIFGLHVHVGIDDREKAIHVANGMRLHVPLLLALSANSPFWRGHPTGLASARMPIFRGFPRVGVPPEYDGWKDFEDRIAFMTEAGVIDDYTWMWYDVRPHPNLGTVEIRAMDAQTRVEHTLGLAALVQAMVRELAEGFSAGDALPRATDEVLDANRWLAARHGLDGELVDLPRTDRVATRELARRVLDRLEPHARDLGSAAELEAVGDLIERGNGAHRQQVVYEANEDFTELVKEVVQATAGDA